MGHALTVWGLDLTLWACFYSYFMDLKTEACQEASVQPCTLWRLGVDPNPAAPKHCSETYEWLTV